ncbi:MULTISPECIES: LysE family translocator [unclassified Stappia]|uniref:LysE family translocator n=1 Tax=unclassified Stappia TaxID=2629676 RepID=UPI001643DBA4|nr:MULTISPECIES: LysE family translocator [unclassified Stappia]
MGWEFLLTALVVVLSPGTGVVYTVATGLARGRLPGIAAAFGCTLGILPALIAATFGLAALLHASALAFQVLKYAGAAYLFYLAWQALRNAGPLAFDRDTSGPADLVAVARTGFLINMLNPKLSLFFLAFLPQFLAPGQGAVELQILSMGSVFMGLTLVAFIGYGVFAAAVGARALRSRQVMAWMSRTVAVAFAGFGARLALAER